MVQSLLALHGGSKRFINTEPPRAHVNLTTSLVLRVTQYNRLWFPVLYSGSNSLEGSQACGGVSHMFGVVQPYRTSSNNCTTEGTRNTGQFRISLGWIYTSKPVRTNAQHKEPDPLGSFACIWSGSTLPNLPEPLCYRGNMAYW